jgi:exonuclease SbcC
VPCGNNFPTCKFIAESHKNKALLKEQKDLVGNLKVEVEEAKIKVSELENEGLKQKIIRYRELVKNVSDLEMKHLVLSTKIEKFKSQGLDLRQKLELLEDSIASMELSLDNEKSSALKKLQSTLERLSNQKVDLNNELFSCVRNIGQATAKITQLEDESLEYDKLQVEWKVYDFLLKATSWRGIPTYIMSKQIPIINGELCNILQDVAGFTVELHVDDKNTDIFINYGDSRRPIECASGMEKMVSSMALRVALGNVSNLNKSDMFVVDEGFGSLDPQNLEAVSNLLHRFKKYYRLIVIISHVDIIKDSVDEILEITKVGKDSKVVYE